MIGTKTSGSPTLVSMRACTKNQKSESGLILVITYIESAMMVAPMAIRYLGWTRVDSKPVTNIITSVTGPGGGLGHCRNCEQLAGDHHVRGRRRVNAVPMLIGAAIRADDSSAGIRHVR